MITLLIILLYFIIAFIASFIHARVEEFAEPPERLAVAMLWPIVAFWGIIYFIFVFCIDKLNKRYFK